jgi:predicted transcriptional regulator
MIELNEIIFIKDKDYLENHDIVVIPSDLCNYENNINNIKTEEKKNSDGKILKENDMMAKK